MAGGIISNNLHTHMQNKKTVKLIGFMGLHTEMGGIFAHRDLNHRRQMTADRRQKNGE
jgi:hypothetical protein